MFLLQAAEIIVTEYGRNGSKGYEINDEAQRKLQEKWEESERNGDLSFVSVKAEPHILRTKIVRCTNGGETTVGGGAQQSIGGQKYYGAVKDYGKISAGIMLYPGWACADIRASKPDFLDDLKAMQKELMGFGVKTLFLSAASAYRKETKTISRTDSVDMVGGGELEERTFSEKITDYSLSKDAPSEQQVREVVSEFVALSEGAQ